MKNIEELKSWFEDDKLYVGGYVKYKIDQLDELRVLSQEWMDKYVVHVRGLGDIIEAEAVESLLVPKQELPAIPKFVADYLDFAKSDVPLMRVMELANTRNEWPKWEKEYDWISANDELFVRAWLDGFTIANEDEEQKYYVVLEENSYGAMGLGIDSEGSLTFTATQDKWSLPKLTEQEIKDYDERFWPFAVKVEELEERE